MPTAIGISYKHSEYQMPKKPFQNTELATFIDRRLLELKSVKAQNEIAEEAGFTSPNVISMIRSGAMKLPIDRVPALAEALDCDAAHLLRLALMQTMGNTVAAVIIEIMGTPVSKNEEAWIDLIRTASNGTDPRPTQRTQAALKAIFT